MRAATTQGPVASVAPIPTISGAASRKNGAHGKRRAEGDTERRAPHLAERRSGDVRPVESEDSGLRDCGNCRRPRAGKRRGAEARRTGNGVLGDFPRDVRERLPRNHVPGAGVCLTRDITRHEIVDSCRRRVAAALRCGLIPYSPSQLCGSWATGDRDVGNLRLSRAFPAPPPPRNRPVFERFLGRSRPRSLLARFLLGPCRRLPGQRRRVGGAVRGDARRSGSRLRIGRFGAGAIGPRR